MKKLIFIFTLAVVAACSPKVSAPAKSESAKTEALSPELTEGKANYEAKCQRCHDLKSPASQTVSGWNEIVPEMVGKANKKTEMIDASTQASILKYLSSEARK